MGTHASGTFEVKIRPLPADEKVEGLTVGRVSIDKQFKGDIEGTSKGEMMTDQLAGLTGKMKIIIDGGQHSYEFDYTLPEAP